VSLLYEGLKCCVKSELRKVKHAGNIPRILLCSSGRSFLLLGSLLVVVLSAYLSEVSFQ
jgi:hypothetical protein